MSSVTRPRGPLPARVYWVRRLVVLAVAFAMVAGLARLLAGGSDAQDDQTTGTAVQAGTSRSRSADASTAGPKRGPRAGASLTPPGSTVPPGPPPAPPLPDGPCEDREVVVTPVVDSAIGGQDVAVRLEISSDQAGACWFRVSPDSVAVKIVSGSDFIWSTRQCPRAVPERVVAARSIVPAAVNVIWPGRRSDAACTPGLAFAEPGYYRVSTAALGGQPRDLQFLLRAAPTRTITRSPEPRPTLTAEATREPGAGPSASPSRLPVVRPSGLPSRGPGAIEPSAP